MTNNLINDRGVLDGSRINVYNLLPYFLDATVTEAYVCQVYDLRPEQVAAARAYVLNNPETVLAQHLKIEERIAAGNPPEVIEQMKKTHETFLKFKDWLTRRQQADKQEKSADNATHSDQTGSTGFPTFREWIAEQQSQQEQAS